jgi:uncharacterized membrane protein YukC
MKTLIRGSGLCALLVTLLLPFTIVAAEAPESPLHNEMEAMNRSFRSVGRQYADPAQKASTLSLVADMLKHAQTARTLTPPKADKMSGDQQTNYIDTFHKDLDALIKEIGSLQQAVAADKTDLVKAEIDKIAQLKGSSHKELGVDGGGKRHGPQPPPQPPPPGP